MFSSCDEVSLRQARGVDARHCGGATGRRIVNRLNAETRKGSPMLRHETVCSLGAVITRSTPEELQAFVQTEVTKLAAGHIHNASIEIQ